MVLRESEIINVNVEVTTSDKKFMTKLIQTTFESESPLETERKT